jgi:hypothetical protein
MEIRNVLFLLMRPKKFSNPRSCLAFANTDEVPLGYKTTQTGNPHHQHRPCVDGLMENQGICILKDNLLNIVHDLNVSSL